MAVKLKALVVDRERAGDFLRDSLANLPDLVSSVNRVNSLPDVKHELETNPPNAIFIDPVSFGLDEGAKLVFDIRTDYSQIPFVLYFDFEVAHANPAIFYKGQRKRFKHYYKLNKETAASIFRDELIAVVKECQGYLGYYVKAHEIVELQNELKRIEDVSSGHAVSVPVKLLTEVLDQVSSLNDRLKPAPSEVKEGSVFLSHRFVEKDYVEGLQRLLEKEGFTVVTGQDAPEYISRGILDRIKSAEFFLSLMTKDKERKEGGFTTSPWLLEEKGAAIALNKKIILMIEEGISENEVGGLQGDWQRIHFTVKGFTNAALRAIDQLKRYVR